MSGHTPGKRFYEKDPKVAKFVKLLETFPVSLRSLVLDALIALAEQKYKADELMHSLRSIGSEKVLALFQSKKKRRSYDSEPVFHQAMNYLLILSEEDRHLLAEETMGLMRYFLDYIKSCKELQQEVSDAKLIEIRESYLWSGQDACRALFERIISEAKQQSQNSGESKTPATEPDSIPSSIPQTNPTTDQQAVSHEKPEIPVFEPNAAPPPSRQKLKEDSQGMRITKQNSNL